MAQRLLAVSAILGEILLSLIGPVDSALYKFIPPTPSTGRIAKANITMPIPPNHCNSCLYISTDGERTSISLITVAPVVVQPDIDSKKASLNESESCWSNINGIAPNKLKITQNSTTIRYPSLIFISRLEFLLGKYSINPKNIIIKNE
mgnify:CR=1 FL=1